MVFFMRTGAAFNEVNVAKHWHVAGRGIFAISDCLVAHCCAGDNEVKLMMNNETTTHWSKIQHATPGLPLPPL